MIRNLIHSFLVFARILLLRCLSDGTKGTKNGLLNFPGTRYGHAIAAVRLDFIFRVFLTRLSGCLQDSSGNLWFAAFD